VAKILAKKQVSHVFSRNTNSIKFALPKNRKTKIFLNTKMQKCFKHLLKRLTLNGKFACKKSVKHFKNRTKKTVKLHGLNAQTRGKFLKLQKT